MERKPFRYTKQQLWSWQGSCEETNQRQSIIALLPPELLDGSAETTPASRRRRNVDSGQRFCHQNLPRPREISASSGVPPLFFQPKECVVEEICTLDEDFLHSDEEEDATEDSEDEISLQPLAFMVEGEPDFESGSPQDGFEYLRRVRWEAAQCPKVKVAKIGEKTLTEQTKYMPEIAPIPSCSPDLLPSKAWVLSFLKDFSVLRTVMFNTSVSKEHLEALPPIRNKAMWFSVCFGKTKGTLNDGSSDEQDNDIDRVQTDFSSISTQNRSPYLKLLLRLDENSRATLFRYHVMWLNDQRQLLYNRAMWLFALAASVDSPLDDQTSAAFRDMLRKCAELRSLKTEGDTELYMINILITIAGEFFGQAEDCCIVSA